MGGFSLMFSVVYTHSANLPEPQEKPHNCVHMLCYYFI